jgi:hypothetical protein
MAFAAMALLSEKRKSNAEDQGQTNAQVYRRQQQLDNMWQKLCILHKQLQIVKKVRFLFSGGTSSCLQRIKIVLLWFTIIIRFDEI